MSGSVLTLLSRDSARSHPELSETTLPGIPTSGALVWGPRHDIARSLCHSYLQTQFCSPIGSPAQARLLFIGRDYLLSCLYSFLLFLFIIMEDRVRVDWVQESRSSIVSQIVSCRVSGGYKTTSDERCCPRRPDYPGTNLNNLRKQADWQQFSLPPYSKKVAGSIPSPEPYSTESVSSPCVCEGSLWVPWLPPKGPKIHMWGKLANGCLYFKQTLWRTDGLFEVLPLTYDSWERLQQTPVTFNVENRWMDGWVGGLRSSEFKVQLVDSTDIT